MEKRRKKKGKGRKTGEIKNRGRAGGDGKGEKRDNVFKMAPDFRGRLDLTLLLHEYSQNGGTCSTTRTGNFLSF